MLLFSGRLSNLFGLSQGTPFTILGAGLLVFGGFVYFISEKQLLNKKLVQIITSLDALWVLGSLGIVVFQFFNLTSTGYLIITLVMVIIAIFAVNQYRFNK